MGIFTKKTMSRAAERPHKVKVTVRSFGVYQGSVFVVASGHSKNTAAAKVQADFIKKISLKDSKIETIPHWEKGWKIRLKQLFGYRAYRIWFQIMAENAEVGQIVTTEAAWREDKAIAQAKAAIMPKITLETEGIGEMKNSDWKQFRAAQTN